MQDKKLLAILLVAVISIVQSSNCPDKATIEPCYCSDQDGESYAKCSQITDPSQISKFVDGSDGVFYKEVLFQDFTLEAIPTDLQRLDMESLVLSKLRLTRLVVDVPKFTGSKLKNLTIEASEVSSGIKWENLQYMTGLETLVVRKTSVPYIDADFNLNVPHELTYAEFTETSTLDVKKGALTDFRKLETFIVDSGKLSDVHNNAFPSPSNIRNLGFPHNHLTTIREDFLENMPNLKNVNLEGNDISKISEPSELGPYERMDEIDFSNNPIKCDCYLKWIPDIDNKQTFKGFCAAPQKLKGKPLSLLTHQDFNHCG